MIGVLPTTLEISGKEYKIRTDFRVILNIIAALNDRELTEQEKAYVCIKCLYESPEKIPDDDMEKALEKAFWFIDCGDNMPEDVQPLKLYDWKQDENIIFPAVSKTAGFPVRSAEYLHWWEFIGYFYEIGEGTFSQVVSIREKQKKGKKLEKYEKDFYHNHKNMVDLREQKSEQELRKEQEDKEFLDKLLGR